MDENFSVPTAKLKLFQAGSSEGGAEPPVLAVSAAQCSPGQPSPVGGQRVTACLSSFCHTDIRLKMKTRLSME